MKIRTIGIIIAEFMVAILDGKLRKEAQLANSLWCKWIIILTSFRCNKNGYGYNFLIIFHIFKRFCELKVVVQ